MSISALWRRLDTMGHDAALITPSDNGWSLTGTAVFQHDDGPACLNYRVELDERWITQRGVISGFLHAQPIDFVITRRSDEWFINGKLQAGLGHLDDLDFGFTPATNLQQLRRMQLEVGESAELPVAWLDASAADLVELPQRYLRRDRTSYDYEAPSVPYRATLEIDQSGFVKRYPGLWELEHFA
jgi:hypothetical protein